MKQFRKVFAALLMVLSIVLACIGVQAFADESEEKYEPFFAEEDILDAWGSFTQEEQADYAGVYVAEDTVVLRFKEGSDSLENATSRNSKNAKMLVDKEKKLQQSLVIESSTSIGIPTKRNLHLKNLIKTNGKRLKIAGFP